MEDFVYLVYCLSKDIGWNRGQVDIRDFQDCQFSEFLHLFEKFPALDSTDFCLIQVYLGELVGCGRQSLRVHPTQVVAMNVQNTQKVLGRCKLKKSRRLQGSEISIIKPDF